MERHQTIFVLRDGKIIQFRRDAGKLALQTSKGLAQVDYSEQYWQNWKDANYFNPEEDILDALFLADDENFFGQLPEWCFGMGKSKWSLDSLTDLAHEELFSTVRLSVIMAGEFCPDNNSISAQQRCRLHLRPSLQLPLGRLLAVLLDNRMLVWEYGVKNTMKIVRLIKFHRSQLSAKIGQFLSEMVKCYRFSSKDELTISLLENQDELLTRTAVDALGATLRTKIPLAAVLKPYITQMQTDNTKEIAMYGVNFGGCNWLPCGRELKKSKFSLLAYTLDNDDFLSYCSKLMQ